MARNADYISKAMAFAAMIIDGIEGLKSLQDEWIYGDYTNTLVIPPEFTFTRGDLSGAIDTTANALDALLAQGHGTNLTKIRQ